MKYHELTEKLIKVYAWSPEAEKAYDTSIRKYLSEMAKELADGDVASEEWNRTRLGLEEVVETNPTEGKLIDQAGFVQACQELKASVGKLADIVEKLPNKNFGAVLPVKKSLEEVVAEAIARWWGSSVSDSTIECAQAAIKVMRENSSI